ncbi:FecR domain-containing protein [Luteolibacter sp. Populi]|uniref:FecR domain-containing protein n=1 Tax=Luteolibacter sp. Populi TaxID=3230487 RepID=UPI0034658F2D
MDHDWQNWIDRLKSNDLTEAELREFQEAVESDPAHRDAYLDALLAEVALEAGDLPQPFAKPEAEVIAMPVRRWPRAAAIAAGIVLLATASYFVGSRSGSIPAASAPSYLATITDADGIAEAAGLRIGQPLEKGPLAIPEGSEIGIAMRGGARLKVRGPAELQIDAVDKIRLAKGRISTYAPTYAHGFTVDTADGSVVDLGTRFVTAAGTASGTEIHVLEGLVEAHVTAEDPAPQNLKGLHAAILKSGKMEPTEFLAQRLVVPLDPVLQDQDSDGFPDVVESFYSTRPDAASDKPQALRIEESFATYAPGPFLDMPVSAAGAKPGAPWGGAGSFEATGLSYAAAGKSLKTTGGAISTTGETGVGAILFPSSRELPPVGVTYVSFLMQNPTLRASSPFAGLLLYQGDREELFVGKLSTGNSFGSRLKQSDQDAFGIPMDSQPHLFVVRIDRNRLVTDVFVDPVPGQPEASAVQRFRYQAVPNVDRIVVRSGCQGGKFPSTFDEIRVGLTWDSVVPVAE